MTDIIPMGPSGMTPSSPIDSNSSVILSELQLMQQQISQLNARIVAVQDGGLIIQQALTAIKTKIGA